MESPHQRGRTPVPVEVDPATGRWSVHEVPMVLVPRHLLTNSLAAIEDVLGEQAAAMMLRGAGRRSARQWCAQEAAALELTGAGIVEHYLEQMSRRGWGRFRLVHLDLTAGIGIVTVSHSAFAARPAPDSGGACYPFGAWLEGAVDYARADPAADPVIATETSCAAAGGDCCVFGLATVPDSISHPAVRSCP